MIEKFTLPLPTGERREQRRRLPALFSSFIHTQLPPNSDFYFYENNFANFSHFKKLTELLSKRIFSIIIMYVRKTRFTTNWRADGKAIKGFVRFDG